MQNVIKYIIFELHTAYFFVLIISDDNKSRKNVWTVICLISKDLKSSLKDTGSKVYVTVDIFQNSENIQTETFRAWHYSVGTCMF